MNTRDKTIKMIAVEIGYNDPYYFSRVLKKVMGQSPKVFGKSRLLILII